MPVVIPNLPANQAVRYFLASIGAHYWGEIYDVKSKRSAEEWDKIKVFFSNSCVYCGTTESQLGNGRFLQMEHLLECNQYDCGLHHPSNTVPACGTCNNSRHQKKGGVRPTWQDHLKFICETKSHNKAFIKRRKRIYEFRQKWPYPDLSEEQRHFIFDTCKQIYGTVRNIASDFVKEFKKMEAK